MPIENISDTARWVATYRAMESARRDAIFNDPFAARLAGTEGPRIVAELKRGESMAWPMVVRTAVFDEMIMDRVANGGIDTVVNLAAGLDARAWRMPLPPSLHWIDVDLPAISEYQANVMRGEQPACKYEAIAADLTDASARTALFARIDAESKTALIVTEGLLIYLSAEQVTELARDIHAMRCARWWLFDLASARLLPIMNRRWGGAEVAAAKAPFPFAPAEGTAFFDRLGWHEVEFRSGLGEAHRLHREMRMAPLWRLLSRLAPPERREEIRRMSGYVMLQRNA
jgi:methyltransferase (TIGR00027 family)